MKMQNLAVTALFKAQSSCLHPSLEIVDIMIAGVVFSKSRECKMHMCLSTSSRCSWTALMQHSLKPDLAVLKPDLVMC